jgi:TPR repeat protein
MEILQLLSAVPDSELDANQDAVNHFKSFDQSNTKKNIARAKLLIPYCFSIKPREVQKIAADYWDIKSGVSKTKGSDSISMEDLHRTHYQFLSDWYKAHNILSPRETDRGKFYNLTRQSAEAGELESMFILGLMYSDGYGVKQDPEQAIYWLRVAATQQHAHAQCTIGYMLFGGWGAEKDEEQGMAWLETAAQNGSTLAKGAIEKIRKGGR